ncbi:MAG: inositol monophosphatase, partial [Kofleriaceae bacterium]|nr:inositol monophosphatase [Kofleriaceae bacterium]
MTAKPEHREALAIASQVAAEAAVLLRGAQEDIGEIRNKSTHRDWVTQWDTRAEELILSRLHQLAPGVPVLAEESGQHGSEEASTYWLVDPIDGTVNFAHGLPLFGICISLEEAGQPVAAAVEAPAMSWTFAASLGGGSTCNGKPMSVSKRERLDESILASGFPYDRATSGHNFPQWEHFQRKAGACRRFGAASLDLCMVAKGVLDGYWETRLSPWDLSAGALMV